MYLRFLAHCFVAALIYSFGALAIGWSLGGPDLLGGLHLFAPTITPLIQSPVARATLLVAALAAALAWFSLVDRRADAIVHAVTGNDRSLKPVLRLVGLALGASILCFVVLSVIHFVTGAPAAFFHILQTVSLALLGVTSIGPIAHAAFRSAGWDSGQEAQVAHTVGDFFGALEHVFSGNPRGLVLGLLGASVFLELGIGETNVSFLLLFYVPLLNASVDALSWLVSVRLLAYSLPATGQRPSTRIWLPYAGTFCVLAATMAAVKFAALATGAGIYNGVTDENQLPWPSFIDAFLMSPMTRGLSVTTMAFVAAAVPVSCLLFLTTAVVARSSRWPIAAMERLKRLG